MSGEFKQRLDAHVVFDLPNQPNNTLTYTFTLSGTGTTDFIQILTTINSAKEYIKEYLSELIITTHPNSTNVFITLTDTDNSNETCSFYTCYANSNCDGTDCCYCIVHSNEYDDDEDKDDEDEDQDDEDDEDKEEDKEQEE